MELARQHIISESSPRTRSASRKGAAQRVFNVVELLELVLVHFPLHKIQAATGVNTIWRDVVNRSTTLQHMLFMRTGRISNLLNPTLESFEGLWAAPFVLNPVLACTIVLPRVISYQGAIVIDAVILDSGPMNAAFRGFRENLVEVEEKPKQGAAPNATVNVGAQPARAADTPKSYRLREGDVRPIQAIRRTPPPSQDLSVAEPAYENLVRERARQPSWKMMLVAHPPIKLLLARQSRHAEHSEVMRRDSGVTFRDILLAFDMLTHRHGKGWMRGFGSNTTFDVELMLPLHEENGEIATLPDGAELWRAAMTRLRCRVETEDEYAKRIAAR